MSLQAKFAILVGLMGLAVVGSLGASIVAIEVEHRQLAGPLRSMTAALDGLARIDRGVGVQDSLLRETGAPSADATNAAAAPPSAPHDSIADQIEKFRLSSEAIQRQLDALAANPIYAERAGRSTSRNVASRLTEFHDLAEQWFGARDPAIGREARRAAIELGQLVTRIEGHVFEVQAKALEHADVIRFRLFAVLASALLAALLLSLLALILLRRWVSRPVGELRIAAERIAAGEFNHRVRGDDERGDEIEQLAHEVNHMAAMIQSMLDERVGRERLAAIGEMVRRLAHNLRNPLTGIRSLAELTREDLPRSSELRQNQQRIILAVDRFEKWLADLLSVTSERPLALAPQPSPVAPLLSGVAVALRPLLESRGLMLEIDTDRAPKMATFDPQQLEHTLVAIVTNAIQASSAGGRIRIVASSGPEQGRWEIRVSDQGPGIPAGIRARIFSPYFTTKKDGNGIGLTVANQVVRAHGGRIRFEDGLGGAELAGRSGGSGGGGGESRPGAGATFIIELPLAGPNDNEPPAGKGVDAGGGGSTSDASPTQAPAGIQRNRGATVGNDPDHRGRREHSLLDR